MIGGARLFEDGVLVELWVGRRVVAAVEDFVVVFLDAMVGQGLAGDLPAGDASAVGERGEEDGVGAAALLDDVEDLVDSFIDEGNGADLDADGFGWARGRGGDALGKRR